MDNLDFSEEEIQQQLALLGYADVPDHRLREFKRDLERLIQNGGGPDAPDPATSPGSFLRHRERRGAQVGGRPSGRDGCARRDDEDSPGSRRGGGPARALLPDAGGGRFIKRKVLRKREGRSLVCDESIYSRDPELSDMYRMCRESGESSPSPSLRSGEEDGARRPEARQAGRERDSGGEGSQMRRRDDGAGSRDSFYDDAGPESEGDGRGSGVPQKEPDGKPDARSEGRKKLGGKPEDGELIRSRGDDREAADSFRELHPGAGAEEAERKAEGRRRALRLPRAAETRRHSLDREIPPAKSPSDRRPDGSGPPDKNAEEGRPGGRSRDGKERLGLRSDSGEGDEREAISAEAEKPPRRRGGPDAPGEAERTPACEPRRPSRTPGRKVPAGILTPAPQGTTRRVTGMKRRAEGAPAAGTETPAAAARKKRPATRAARRLRSSTLSRTNAGVRPSPAGVAARARRSDSRSATASDGSALLPDRLSRLRLGQGENHHAGVPSDSAEGVSLGTCMTRSRSESDFRAKPKSFIRPLVTQRTIKKMDPVARYFHYKQLWDQLKLPGERDHRQLRWEIRERLAYRPPAPKARRSLAANGYVVPTDKKRSALRWEVRSLMAHPHLPHRFTCRF